MTEETKTNPPALPVVTLDAYKPFVQQLPSLRKANAAAKFDYSKPAQLKAGKAHLAMLRKSRKAIEDCRVDTKKEFLEKGRKVDSESKPLLAALDVMIEPHATAIKAVKEREEQRVANLSAGVDELRELWAPTNEPRTVAELTERLEKLQACILEADIWEEFLPEAGAVVTSGITSLTDQIARQQEQEAKDAELEELRLKNEKREREDAERKQKEADDAAAEQQRLEAEEAAEKQRIADEEAAAAAAEEQRIADEAAERQRLADEEAAEQQRIADEAAAEEKRIADEAAEKQRIADLEAQTIADAKAKVEREAEEQRVADAKRAADRANVGRVSDEIELDLMNLGLSQKTADIVLQGIIDGDVRNVEIKY